MIKKLEKQLESIVNKGIDGRLKDAMRYALLNGGKRLRPRIVLSVIQCYKPYADYVDIAASIEMIHTYSLVHDDLPAMDDDALRRGKPSTHIAYDEATAILVGDALLTDAFFIASSNEKVDPVQTKKIIQVLSKYAGSQGMVNGQMLDMLFEDKNQSLEAITLMHKQKTGKLITAAFLIGAIIGNQADQDTWALIGDNLGQAFQLQDDLIDYKGNEAIAGKTLSDQINQKQTIVSAHGVKQTNALIEDYFQTIDDLLETIKGDKTAVIELINTIRYRVS